MCLHWHTLPRLLCRDWATPLRCRDSEASWCRVDRVDMADTASLLRLGQREPMLVTVLHRAKLLFILLLYPSGLLS